MDSPQSIPTLGKLYLATTIVLSLLVFTTSLDPYNLAFTLKQTIFQLGLWRPFTAILYLSRISILFPFHLLFAFVAFRYAVKKVYGQSSKADLVWTFFLSAIALGIFSAFTGLYFYGNSFIMILLMMWAVQYPTDHLIVFKFYINSIYIPLAYAAVMIFLGSSYKNYMAGFLLGLFLGFIRNPTFIEKNGEILPTPDALKNYFEGNQTEFIQERVLYANARQQIQVQNRVPRGEYFSGAGYRIG